MTRGSVVRRSWSSFTTGRRAASPRAGERGRAGYALWQRAWASFTGINLPSRPGRVPDTAPRLTPAPRPQATPAAAGWFALPSLPAAGALTASGSDTVVLEAPSPDGRAVFVLRRTGGQTAEYVLELVVRDSVDQPELVTVTYTGPDGEEHTLLIPVSPSSFGPAASFVRLNGFAAGSTWQATGPALIPEDPDWPSATVAHSVRAARNEATREAWRRVRECAGQGVRDTIDGAL
ncbi:hypothetical protein [Streptomyces sp. bgisy034]|uniref:hypothetical protein n=1 Tax=Streptomyces sp. bgisy034 TaxID=3413774 RepID=UPI003EB9434C